MAGYLLSSPYIFMKEWILGIRSCSNYYMVKDHKKQFLALYEDFNQSNYVTLSQ